MQKPSEERGSVKEAWQEQKQEQERGKGRANDEWIATKCVFN